MKTVEKKLSEIRPYEKNPRKNDDAVKYVVASIKEFGFKVPIIIDRNGVIVAGHTRYKAAKELGMETVPCVIADDLTDEQVRAFRIADNKVHDQAVWDMDLLGDELRDIMEDIDMTDFGFGDFELTMLTSDMDPEPYDDELVDQYSKNDGDYLAKKRVIITYSEEDEDIVKGLLRLNEITKVVYDAKELA